MISSGPRGPDYVTANREVIAPPFLRYTIAVPDPWLPLASVHPVRTYFAVSDRMGLKAKYGLFLS